MGTISLVTLFSTCFIAFLYVQPTEGGECCRSYVDHLGMFHYQQWCPIFCCGHALHGELECCSDLRLRAFDGNRDGFCAAWFSYPHHIWAPIIIGLFILICIIACCVCCIRCFVCI